MAENKTQKTGASVEGFLEAVEHPRRREDGRVLLRMMQEITGLKPEMWGPSIVGFGDYRYRYDSGREGDFFLVGFSPRKQSLSLYLPDGFPAYGALLAALGKHRKGAFCLYVNKLADVDPGVLRQLITESFEHVGSHGR